MTNGAFLSPTSVAAIILACVALLTLLSALTLAPPERRGRRYVVAFMLSLAAIWAVALLVITLIRRTLG
jgi:uncharacterized membrane protein